MILVTVAVSLTMREYWGDRAVFRRLYPHAQAGWAGDYYELYQYVWWSGWCFACLVVAPVVVILATPGERPRDYYLGLGSLAKDAWIYILLLLLVTPVVYVAAQSKAFHTT